MPFFDVLRPPRFLPGVGALAPITLPLRLPLGWLTRVGRADSGSVIWVAEDVGRFDVVITSRSAGVRLSRFGVASIESSLGRLTPEFGRCFNGPAGEEDAIGVDGRS